jgi:hypothetical protein
LALVRLTALAALAEASLAQSNSAFAFQGVLRPATPTGSKVAVVLAFGRL